MYDDDGGPGIYETVKPQNVVFGSQIGEGREAQVFKATITAKGWDACQTWAVKRWVAEFQNIHKEFDAYEAIDGHGIGPVFGAELQNAETEAPEGFVLEYIDGRPAKGDSLQDARETLATLRRLHELGWIHGDLSSASNAMIRDSDGRAVLIDFSLAREVSDPREMDEDIDRMKQNAFSGIIWSGDEPVARRSG